MNHYPCHRIAAPSLTRREALQRIGLGSGGLALTSLLGSQGKLVAAGAGETFTPIKPRGKVKSVIYIHLDGGLSHVDSFDPKPALAQFAGQDVPESIVKSLKLEHVKARVPLSNLYPSPFEFQQHGQSGLPVSSLFPELAQRVDDLCFIRSMHHLIPIHAPGSFYMLTGSPQGTRPSIGSWLTYGLGSENENMPAFIVLSNGDFGMGGPLSFSAGFLPTQYQGVVVKNQIANLAQPPSQNVKVRRAQLDLLETLNNQHVARLGGNSELEARIRSYEMAYRMQTTAPAFFDLAKETDATKKLYGVGEDATGDFGRRCLLARRFVEGGVRCVLLTSAGWDAHQDLKNVHSKSAKRVDKPIAGLLADLKARGLWDQTLVVCGSEFGRTPTMERRSGGRDHSPQGYTVWLAGGGVKGGQAIGATDDVGYATTESPVSPNDLHATILHALGLGENEIFYLHQGRREIVTNLGGRAVKPVFA